MISLTSKLPHVGTSIFSVMSQLAAENKAINLSQGFPDFECPARLVNLVARHMKNGHNQYAPMPGLLALREKIAEKINHLHAADYHPETEITVTAGGTQAIFTALSAVVHPNDEVIIFEPAYDCYAPTIKLLGGVVKSFELSAPDYKIDWDMFKKLASSHTRLIILNSPHNPTGRVLNEEDIKQLAHLTQNTDILILSDEVYEHLIFEGKPHLSMARYPALRERAFIVASFGKLFHNTGWKLGYCAGPAWLMGEFRKVHQFLIFSVNTPVQYAIADFLKDEGFYIELNGFYQRKRDLFRDLMQQTRFDLLPCQGSYFQCVQYGRLSSQPAFEFAKRLITAYGVAGIPVSAFYSKGTDEGVMRFCFAKKQETLEKAVERLMKV